MNSTTYPRSSRPAVTLALAQAGVLAFAITVSSGCGRRPIIVQAPPATVVQAPAATVAPPPVVGTTTTRDVIVVKEAPPPPREEVPPPPPSNSYTWVPGYWTVRDGRQEWIPGRYEMPPRSGATWVAPRWERRADGYVFVDGYWR